MEKIVRDEHFGKDPLMFFSVLIDSGQVFVITSVSISQGFLLFTIIVDSIWVGMSILLLLARFDPFLGVKEKSDGQRNSEG